MPTSSSAWACVSDFGQRRESTSPARVEKPTTGRRRRLNRGVQGLDSSQLAEGFSGSWENLIADAMDGGTIMVRPSGVERMGRTSRR